jgi:hypothetical protein
MFHIFVGIVFTLLMSTVSFADFGGRQNGHFNRPETGATPTPKEKIQGECVVVPGGGNLMAQPCGNIILTLNSGKGSETLYSRTSNDGSFEFNVPAGKDYKLGVNSRFYEVLSPKNVLERGAKVQVQLKQK